MHLYQGDSDSEGSQCLSDMPRHPIDGVWEQLRSPQEYGRAYDTNSSEMMFDGGTMSQEMPYGVDDLRYDLLDTGTPLNYVTNDDLQMPGSGLFGDGLGYDAHVHGTPMTYGDGVGYTAYPNSHPGITSMLPSIGPNGTAFMSGGGDSLQNAAAMYGVAEHAGNDHNGLAVLGRYVKSKYGSCD